MSMIVGAFIAAIIMCLLLSGFGIPNMFVVFLVIFGIFCIVCLPFLAIKGFVRSSIDYAAEKNKTRRPRIQRSSIMIDKRTVNIDSRSITFKDKEDTHGTEKQIAAHARKG